MPVSVEIIGDATVVTLPGNIYESASVDGLIEAVSAACSGTTKCIQLNMANVKAASAFGVGKILQCQILAETASRGLELVSVEPMIQSLLGMLGIDRIIKIS